jgi:hypothetical protein
MFNRLSMIRSGAFLLLLGMGLTTQAPSQAHSEMIQFHQRSVSDSVLSSVKNNQRERNSDLQRLLEAERFNDLRLQRRQRQREFRQRLQEQRQRQDELRQRQEQQRDAARQWREQQSQQ